MDMRQVYVFPVAESPPRRDDVNRPTTLIRNADDNPEPRIVDTRAAVDHIPTRSGVDAEANAFVPPGKPERHHNRTNGPEGGEPAEDRVRQVIRWQHPHNHRRV